MQDGSARQERAARKKVRSYQRLSHLAMAMCMGIVMGAAWTIYASAADHIQLILIAGAGSMAFGFLGGLFGGNE